MPPVLCDPTPLCRNSLFIFVCVYVYVCICVCVCVWCVCVRAHAGACVCQCVCVCVCACVDYYLCVCVFVLVCLHVCVCVGGGGGGGGSASPPQRKGLNSALDRALSRSPSKLLVVCDFAFMSECCHHDCVFSIYTLYTLLRAGWRSTVLRSLMISLLTVTSSPLVSCLCDMCLVQHSCM